MNDYETSQFIQCVRDRPALWNKDVEEYTNRSVREQLWADIGEIMFPDEWPRMNVKAKTERVKDIKNRWRHIRDSYIKQLRGNQPRKRKREYLHSAALRFIGDLVRRKQGETVQSEEEVTSDDVKAEDQYIAPEVSLATEDYQSPSNSLAQGPSKVYSFGSSFKTEDPLATSSSDQDEADKLFLLSILPDYKRLNEDEKIDFRILVLQYFRNVRQKHGMQTSTPQPNYMPQDVSHHFLG